MVKRTIGHMGEGMFFTPAAIMGTSIRTPWDIIMKQPGKYWGPSVGSNICNNSNIALDITYSSDLNRIKEVVEVLQGEISGLRDRVELLESQL